MKRFLDDDRGQLILIACVSVAAALVLITMYEYSTLGTGEKSINRENLNSYYFYDSIEDRYSQVYQEYQTNSVTVFENDLKRFALLHGYSLDFVCAGGNKKIIFVDKDIKIEELTGISCT
jgi:hypothetical protein